MSVCDRCFSGSGRFIHYVEDEETGEKIQKKVCWDCDHDLINGGEFHYPEAGEILMEREEENYEYIIMAFQAAYNRMQKIQRKVVDRKPLEDTDFQDLIEANRSIKYMMREYPDAISRDEYTVAKAEWLQIAVSIMTKYDLGYARKLLSLEPTLMYDVDFYDILGKRKDSDSGEVGQFQKTLYSILDEYTKKKFGVPLEGNTRRVLANELVYLLLTQG